jgi:hypothetical protein
MAMNRDDPFAIFGFRGEPVMREFLTNLGFWVSAISRDSDSAAPLIESMLRKHVLPDIQASRGGLTRWVEVKSKDSATKYNKTGTFQTGCYIRHFDDYLSVQKATGIPGWIGFQHAMDARIYMQSLDILVRNIHHSHPTGGRLNQPTHYWDLDTMDWYDMDMNSLTVKKWIASAQPRLTVRIWENPDSKGPSEKQHRFLW